MKISSTTALAKGKHLLELKQVSILNGHKFNESPLQQHFRHKT